MSADLSGFAAAQVLFFVLPAGDPLADAAGHETTTRPAAPLDNHRMAEVMNKASEYRVNARKCRALASKTNFANDREALLRMAELWEQLARDRVDLVQKHPELSGDTDQTQGGAPASTGRAPTKR